MASAIDSTKPVAGNASTSNVRANFAAAEAEINEFQRATEDSVTAGGTADVLTANFVTDVVLAEGITIVVLAASANATTTPTLNVDGTGAKTIVKGDGGALVAGDIAGTRHYLVLRFDATNSVWVLLNPENSPDADKLVGVAGGSYARKDQANTFTEDQTIRDAASSTTLTVGTDTGFDSIFRFQENGITRANVTYDESLDALRIKKFDTNGSTIKAEIQLLNNGNVEVITGNLIAGTQSVGDNTTKAASTEYVQQEFDGSQQSLVEDGFQKFPGGFIMQWGKTASVADGTTITFPTAFTTTFSVVLTPIDNSNLATAAVDTITATNFKVQHGGGNATEVFNWIATGK